MKKTTTTPHDATFKAFLTHHDTARDFIELHLPAELRAVCDLSTLNVRKLVIRNKEHLMRQLSRFGINESTVYLGIVKATTEIAKLYDGRS